jgi:hypothetical protein
LLGNQLLRELEIEIGDAHRGEGTRDSVAARELRMG